MFVKILAVFLCITIAHVNAGCKNIPKVGDLEVGESKAAQGECTIATCTGEGTVAMKTCPEFVALPPCKPIQGNSELLYPDCCPKFECPKETEK
ncbi:complement inhibitor CirpT3-like isoform X1 [Diorhabda carinulata]|nr:complement inhibitor CirpT3-like isoform X1 [Diorhabda carinulata]